MEWTHQNGVWASGPYTIELIEPKRWVLTRTPMAGRGSKVRVDQQMTGSSLSGLKMKAERIEAARGRKASTARTLAYLLISGVILGSAVVTSGRLAGVVGIVAFFAFLTLVSRVMKGLERRPWDTLMAETRKSGWDQSIASDVFSWTRWIDPKRPDSVITAM